MDEWMVITVIMTLVGLIAAIATPLVKLNTTITKLNTTVSVMEKNLDALIVKNTQNHDRLWVELNEQNDTLASHETRITLIEKHTKHT